MWMVVAGRIPDLNLLLSSIDVYQRANFMAHTGNLDYKWVEQQTWLEDCLTQLNNWHSCDKHSPNSDYFITGRTLLLEKNGRNLLLQCRTQNGICVYSVPYWVGKEILDVFLLNLSGFWWSTREWYFTDGIWLTDQHNSLQMGTGPCNTTLCAAQCKLWCGAGNEITVIDPILEQAEVSD